MLQGSAQMKISKVVERPSMEETMKEWGEKYAPPPAQVSSHLKNKRTGQVLPWLEKMAVRTDLFDNCDSQGNTDKSAWEGTRPYGWTEAAALKFAPVPDGFNLVTRTGISEERRAASGGYLPESKFRETERMTQGTPVPVPAAGTPMGDAMALLKSSLSTRWEVD